MAYPTNEKDPQHHAEKVQRMLTDVIEHVREDVGKVDEPKFQALLETSAEEQGDSCDVNRRLRTANEKTAIDCFDVAGRNDWHRPAI